jgi:hypothetical protein
MPAPTCRADLVLEGAAVPDQPWIGSEEHHLKQHVERAHLVVFGLLSLGQHFTNGSVERQIYSRRRESAMHVSPVECEHRTRVEREQCLHA